MMTDAYGDQTWFPFRALTRTAPSFHANSLDLDCRTVVQLVISIQSFPLAQKPPIAVPGMLERPFPDVTVWTQRKVGVREGLWRLGDLLEREAVPATFVIEADAIPEIDAFADVVTHGRNSIVAGGLNAAALHCAPETAEVELARIDEVLKRVGAFAGRPVDTWHSPSGVHSPDTMRLLCQAGAKNVLDLNNDELPYELATDRGTMLSLPWQHFSSDLHCIFVCKQSTSDYLADLTEGLRWLSDRPYAGGPTVQTIPLHPWIMGAPHRFKLFSEALRLWKQIPGLRFCNSDEIVAARKAQSAERH